MEHGASSSTALVVAALRAAHQTHDDGRVFRDPYAEDMLGPEGAPLMMGLPIVPGYRVMRFFMAARSRYADDALAEAVDRGCRQVVVLGLREYVSQKFRELVPSGLKILDLELNARVFQRPLPRMLPVNVDEFDPMVFM